MLIELPSGLKGEARKIRGSEAIELAERAGDPKGNSLGSILGGCWLRTVDPGPYDHAAEGRREVDWDRALKGDLLAGLLQLRAASVPSTREVKASDPWPGARYEFRVQCERVGCRKTYPWVILDVVKDLPVRTLSAASAARVRSGEKFSATAVDADGVEHALTYDLMLPEQDPVLRTMLKQLNRKRVTAVESLATQTRTVDGAAKSPAVRQAFFRDLDLGELNRLRDLYDESDCGVTVEVLTECQEPDCGWEQVTSLPFGRTFWRPEIPKAPDPKPKETPPTATA